MLLMLSMRLSAAIHYFLWAYAPTNILLRWLRTRNGLKWAIPAALLLVPAYLFMAAITTSAIAEGGPGWLNLVVLTCIWDAMKFGIMLPVRLIQSFTSLCRRRVADVQRVARESRLS